jgi:hypothetical protein
MDEWTDRLGRERNTDEIRWKCFISHHARARHELTTNLARNAADYSNSVGPVVVR